MAKQDRKKTSNEGKRPINDDLSGWRSYWGTPGLSQEDRQSLEATKRRMEREGKLKPLSQSEGVYRQAAARHGKEFEKTLDDILPVIQEYNGLREKVNKEITVVDALVSELGAVLDSDIALRINKQLDEYDLLASEIKTEINGERLIVLIDGGDQKALILFGKKIGGCIDKVKRMFEIAESVHTAVSKQH